MTCTCQEKSACSSCQPSIVEKQEQIVRALQDLILKFGTAPTGQLKDMAIALGVAVDKLVLLTPKPAPRPLGWNQAFCGASGTAISHAPPKPQNT